MTSLKQQVREALGGGLRPGILSISRKLRGDSLRGLAGKRQPGIRPGGTAGNIWRRWSTRWTFLERAPENWTRLPCRVDAALRAIGSAGNTPGSFTKPAAGCTTGYCDTGA